MAKLSKYARPTLDVWERATNKAERHQKWKDFKESEVGKKSRGIPQGFGSFVKGRFKSIGADFSMAYYSIKQRHAFAHEQKKVDAATSYLNSLGITTDDSNRSAERVDLNEYARTGNKTYYNPYAKTKETEELAKESFVTLEDLVNDDNEEMVSAATGATGKAKTIDELFDDYEVSDSEIKAYLAKIEVLKSVYESEKSKLEQNNMIPEGAKPEDVENYVLKRMAYVGVDSSKQEVFDSMKELHSNEDKYDFLHRMNQKYSEAAKDVVADKELEPYIDMYNKYCDYLHEALLSTDEIGKGYVDVKFEGELPVKEEEKAVAAEPIKPVEIVTDEATVEDVADNYATTLEAREQEFLDKLDALTEQREAHFAEAMKHNAEAMKYNSQIVALEGEYPDVMEEVNKYANAGKVEVIKTEQTAEEPKTTSKAPAKSAASSASSKKKGKVAATSKKSEPIKKAVQTEDAKPADEPVKAKSEPVAKIEKKKATEAKAEEKKAVNLGAKADASEKEKSPVLLRHEAKVAAANEAKAAVVEETPTKAIEAEQVKAIEAKAEAPVEAPTAANPKEFKSKSIRQGFMEMIKSPKTQEFGRNFMNFSSAALNAATALCNAKAMQASNAGYGSYVEVTDSPNLRLEAASNLLPDSTSYGECLALPASV